MNYFTEFIDKERNKYSNKHNNLFATCFSQIERYHQFLEIILKRYSKASNDYINIWGNFYQISRKAKPLKGDAKKLYEDGINLGTILHLEIESFYLFAKILLDKVSLAIEFYFGCARKASLHSHDKLAKNLSAFLKDKKLPDFSEKLMQHLKELKIDIIDYRDKQIIHEKSPKKMCATSFNITSKESAIIATKIYPDENDTQAASIPLDKIMNNIDQYLKEIIEYISENREKTKLTLEEKQDIEDTGSSQS